MRDKSGFTLIELLVVLIIIGTIVTFAILSFGDFGQSRQARASAEQLAQYISLLQHKAILENRLIGVNIHDGSYQAMRYFESKGWQTIDKGSAYRDQPLPKGLLFSLNKKSVSDDVNIIVQPSGDITPFTLYISDKHKKKLIQVSGKANGEVVIHGES